MSDYRNEFEKELDNQDIWFELTAVNKAQDEVVYKFSSPLMESIEMAIPDAHKAVTAYIDKILEKREAKFLSDEAERDDYRDENVEEYKTKEEKL